MLCCVPLSAGDHGGPTPHTECNPVLKTLHSRLQRMSLSMGSIFSLIAMPVPNVDKCAPPKISFIVTTSNRKDELKECIQSIQEQDIDNYEVVVVDNGSNDGTSDLFESGSYSEYDNIRYFRYEERLGVPESRNVAFEKSNGEILVTIDDDAILESRDAASKILSEFMKDDDLGILAFRIEEYSSGNLDAFPPQHNVPFVPQMIELPEEYYNETELPSINTVYFSGGGNAIKKEVIEKIGGYPDGFLYGSEELDFSIRALDNGYTIKFCPAIVVRHKKSPHSRIDIKKIYSKRIENRMRISTKYLPWRYVALSLFGWSLFALYKCRLDIRPIFRAWIRVMQQLPENYKDRNKISKTTLEHIRSHSGRIW